MGRKEEKRREESIREGRRRLLGISSLLPLRQLGLSYNFCHHCVVAEAMQEELQWANELPGDRPPFCTVTMDAAQRGTAPAGLHRGCFLCHRHLPHIPGLV